MVRWCPAWLAGEALLVFLFLIMHAHSRKLNQHHAPRAQASLGLSGAPSFAGSASWSPSRWLPPGLGVPGPGPNPIPIY